jgi:hypothetical protein
MSKVNTLSEFITQAMAYSIIVYSKGYKKGETMIFHTTINKHINKHIAYNLWPNIRSQSYASQHWRIQAFNSSHKKMLTKIKVLFILWKTWHVAQKCSNKKTYKFWNIINEKIQAKNEFCPISIRVLQLDNNTLKETKDIFLPPYVVLCFIIPIDIHTIKQRTCRNISK